MTAKSQLQSNQADPRANAYRILAAALAAPPDAAFLAQIAGLPQSQAEDDCARALQQLRAEAEKGDVEQAADDYQQLLVGLGRGKVIPYGSWHITGSMMDKPLADLRRDLQQLGLQKRKEAGEPEDHAAALCETMAVLCSEESSDSSRESALSFARQQKMFQSHLAPWFEFFFSEISGKAESGFYRALGEFGRAFIAFESRYFQMPL